MKRIGVDVGGTFTDLIYVDEETGNIQVAKVPSTPSDPSEAVSVGLNQVCEAADAELADVDLLFHGTTVATNIALEHKGAEVGLITTHGFRDILHIARHRKPFNFSLQQDLPWQTRPLVKRRFRKTVSERITAPNGDVLVPLNEDEVREKVRELNAAGIKSIAVCFLHSYLNPGHELRVRDIVLEEIPDAYVSASCEVVPLYREFERFSTTALNAYVGPKVSKYLENFENTARKGGYKHGVKMMQSSGGLATVEGAMKRPVNLMMSGPVGGLVGGIWAGKMAGFNNVFTLDIGGTSADIGVSANGKLQMRHLLDTKVGDYQAMIPMIDIYAIGQGGGSLVYVDDGGVFRVGPQSAGAFPGPASYGRGGTQATSTDAQVVLGRLRPDRGLIGGGLMLDVEMGRTVIGEVAKQTGLSVEETALGALQIQKFSMVQAIELNSVRRGYDPREFTLVAAGGAGPLFSTEIAIELEVPNVLVPPHPGILSASGLLATDMQHEFVGTERSAIDELDFESIEANFANLTAQAMERLEADAIPEDRRIVRRLADCRYSGQGYEVRFDVPAGKIDQKWVEAAKDAFNKAHDAEYGHSFKAPIEIINIRVIGVGKIDELTWPESPPQKGDPKPITTRDVVFDVDGKAMALPTPHYDREQLGVGAVIHGPTIIEQYDTTTVVPPHCTVTVDKFGNLIVNTEEAIARKTGELSDPILMRVIGGAFQAIAKEMAGVLYRMSYSSIIRESEDLGAGIFDKNGFQLAESDSTPMFMGAMPKIVQNVIKILGNNICEGDVIFHNDPYGGATHSPDCAVIVPVFYDGELIGFTSASAHLIDIGGAFPGINMAAFDVFAEGSIYKAKKIYEKGVRNEDLWSSIFENVRTPSHNEGDVEALLAACNLAKRRFLELAGRYGTKSVETAGNYWMDYAETMLRKEIAKVPDGEYTTDIGYLDDDGVNRGKQLPVQVKVIIKGDEITYDLTGSSDEVMTSFNCPYEGTTLSALSFITRMIFLDEVAFPVFVPQNEGMTRPINAIVPKGSIFNPNFPRSCFARFCQVQRAVDLALKALAPVLPDKITAGNSAHLHFISYAGFNEDKGEYWVYLEVDEGSYGGRPESDGMDAVDCLIANTRNNPIEELEFTFDMRTERYELRDEACAAGRTRGGIGMVRENRMLVETLVSCEGDRQEGDEPWGILGGEDGLNGSIYVNRGEADEEYWPAKISGKTMKANSTIQITVPSSGGYGNPLERDAQMVLSDVLDDFTTLELAQSSYGVVIDKNSMTVDEAATKSLRQRMAN